MYIIEGSNPSARTNLPIIGGKKRPGVRAPGRSDGRPFSVRRRILGNCPYVFKRRTHESNATEYRDGQRQNCQ